MDQIKFNFVKKKETGQWVFFLIFCMRYTFKSKNVVVIEIPEWKLKGKLARVTIFEGN